MRLKLSALALLAGCLPASAAFVTLTSPNNIWSLASDEFGAFGEGAAGSFAQRNFGSGLTGYGWASAVLLTDGTTNQWLGGAAQFTNGGYAGTALSGANLISDTGVTLGNVRTSVFTAGAFGSLRITLTQTASNGAITQTYSIQNTGNSLANISLAAFHDVDLDGGTFLNNTIQLGTDYLSVTEGARNVYFTSSGPGFAGFLGAHFPNGGITGNLNVIAQTSGGIPAGNFNKLVDVTGSTIAGNFDVNNDGVSDTASDVGYLLQHNLSIPAGAAVTVTLAHSAIPEPTTVGLLGIVGLVAVRRRR